MPDRSLCSFFLWFLATLASARGWDARSNDELAARKGGGSLTAGDAGFEALFLALRGERREKRDEGVRSERERKKKEKERSRRIELGVDLFFLLLPSPTPSPDEHSVSPGRDVPGARHGSFCRVSSHNIVPVVIRRREAQLGRGAGLAARP
jgi:hypothetical protein